MRRKERFSAPRMDPIPSLRVVMPLPSSLFALAHRRMGIEDRFFTSFGMTPGRIASGDAIGGAVRGISDALASKEVSYIRPAGARIPLTARSNTLRGRRR